MASIIDQFEVFRHICEDIKQNIKLFHVFEIHFAICVKNDDEVYAFGEKEKIENYLGL